MIYDEIYDNRKYCPICDELKDLDNFLPQGDGFNILRIECEKDIEIEEEN